MAQEEHTKETQSDTSVKERLKEPKMYKVIMLNDDFTPMDFVVDIVRRVFKKSIQEATEIMLNVHKKGSAVCGVYTYEVAETKVIEVIERAKKNEHPLQCQIEQD